MYCIITTCLCLPTLYWLALILWKWGSLFIESFTLPALDVSVKAPTNLSPSHSAPKCKWEESTKDTVVCFDPSSMERLGEVSVTTPAQVRECIAKARKAQMAWRQSSFPKRRQLLRTMLKFITANADTIARVACRDSGKTVVDAMFGEIMVTCEKLRWTIADGEQYLSPETRASGLMNLHKASWVEFVPVGVVGAIVPFNYPFHNVFNPLIAALFAGNAIVIKVSEYAAWSPRFYKQIIDQCLAAVGAPTELVQIVVGYGETGNALVTGGVDKVIFVGSVGVGRKVMEAASASLTPVILELGGKDPFIVCDDADPEALAQLACRGVFQNMGQNCAGPERFIVHEKVYDRFCASVTRVVKGMVLGQPLTSDKVDCGAYCIPGAAVRYQELVDDAVRKGARVLAGGTLDQDSASQLYPPTVLVDVTPTMLVATEEIFGPIMCVFKVRSDAEAISIANTSQFALSACAHSSDQTRALRICRQLESGMASVNDLEGTTYLSQSLPFGGWKDSGFGRFAGPEGLRGLCHTRSIVCNRAAFLRPSIPTQIAYPSTGQGPRFCLALVQILYGCGVWERLRGVWGIIGVSLQRTDTTVPSAKSVD